MVAPSHTPSIHRQRNSAAASTSMAVPTTLIAGANSDSHSKVAKLECSRDRYEGWDLQRNGYHKIDGMDPIKHFITNHKTDGWDVCDGMENAQREIEFSSVSFVSVQLRSRRIVF